MANQSTTVTSVWGPGQGVKRWKVSFVADDTTAAFAAATLTGVYGYISRIVDWISSSINGLATIKATNIPIIIALNQMNISLRFLFIPHHSSYRLVCLVLSAGVNNSGGFFTKESTITSPRAMLPRKNTQS